ncbi:transposase [Thermoanaerobacter thermohydrosulfuricus]|nr:transposase [Thermoanaerobacter sp. RKWS2]UZQ84314.1 transposase [Thermoanaerobacter sp. RKWS2]
MTNAFDIPYTNSVTEGYNNKIKVLKRIAYGYRNFHRFRETVKNFV